MNLHLAEIPRIRTALIGFGFSGATFHSPFLKALPDFEVTHVVSSQKAKVHALFPDIEVVENTQANACLQNPLIDLVIITAPNQDHYRLAKTALLQGKHVLVEKPFVLNEQEGQELIDLANLQGKILSVFHNRRWDSDFLTVQNIVRSRTLGNISLFINRYDRYRPQPNLARWKESQSQGAGTLWDLGAHLIDQTLQLFGLPACLYADVLAQREGASAADYFDLTFMYGNGMRANLSSSSLCLHPGPKYEIHGTEGSFIKFGHDSQEQALIRGEAPTQKDFGKEPETFHGKIMTKNEGIRTIPSLKGCYLTFFEQLSSAISHRTKPPVAAHEALEVVRIIQLCEESSQTGKIVHVNRTEK